MADVNDPASWYIWFTELSIVPPEYRYILRIISWFFITLALVPIVPIVCLVIYDITLWVWRLLSTRNAERRHAVLEKPGTNITPSPGQSLTTEKRCNGALPKARAE